MKVDASLAPFDRRFDECDTWGKVNTALSNCMVLCGVLQFNCSTRLLSYLQLPAVLLLISCHAYDVDQYLFLLTARLTTLNYGIGFIVISGSFPMSCFWLTMCLSASTFSAWICTTFALKIVFLVFPSVSSLYRHWHQSQKENTSKPRPQKHHQIKYR